jgi:multisubunit Na+/H+ antiporter MnhF subunit
MNSWLIAAAFVFVLCLGPCLWVASRAPALPRLIALNLGGTFACALLLLLAQGYGRTSYVDLGLVATLLAPVGTLVFTRLLRHLPDREPETPAPGTTAPLTNPPVPPGAAPGGGR